MMTPIVAEPFTSASTRQSSVLLSVKHLNVDYETSGQSVHAVHDVSFTLHRGQILGLAGEGQRKIDTGLRHHPAATSACHDYKR